MAKSKRKTRARSGGSRGTATKQAPPTPTVAPASPGGPNRIARKEEARRQREVLRRKMARRRTLRVVGVILALLVIAGAVTAYLMTRPDPAQAAGCAVRVIKPYPGGNDRSHIQPGSPVTTPPPPSSYPSTPPASGPHNGTPLSAGVYPEPPDIYQAIHSLEHGAVSIWYAPGT